MTMDNIKLKNEIEFTLIQVGFNPKLIGYEYLVYAIYKQYSLKLIQFRLKDVVSEISKVYASKVDSVNRALISECRSIKMQDSKLYKSVFSLPPDKLTVKYVIICAVIYLRTLE